MVSIEKIGRDSLLLGWMEALDSVGLSLDLLCYEELRCTEVGEESVFQAFRCLKGVKFDISVRELFDHACSKYLDYSKASYSGWDAKIVFENRRKSLIEGYIFEFTRPHSKGKLSLWTHDTDETCLIVYHNNNGEVSTTFHDISEKEALIEAIHKAVDESRAYGHVRITKMSDK